MAKKVSKTGKLLTSSIRSNKRQRVTQVAQDPEFKFSASTNSEYSNSDDESIDSLTGPDEGSESEEYEYERMHRTWKGVEDEGNGDVVEKLPIKTADGKVKRVVVAKPTNSKKRTLEDSEVNADDYDGTENENENENEDSELPEKDRIRLAKEGLSKLANELIEDPEENIGNLKQLLEYHSNKLARIKMLAIATELMVYKNTIPGYRIRPLTDVERVAKVSKEVKKLRHFEQSLVSGYKQYIESLNMYVQAMFKADTNSDKYKLGITALSCACGLLTSVSHFNFRTDLLNIVIQRLSRKRHMPMIIEKEQVGQSPDDAKFDLCTHTLIELVQDDMEGSVTLDTVQCITKMMKSRKYKVEEEVLNIFLHIKLLIELDALEFQKIESKREVKLKLKKKDRLHRTKKEKKRAKELKEIDEEMRRAEQAVSQEETEKFQSETLKIVFSTYIWILKGQVKQLMGAALEGLAKFAHLINSDLFGDLLEVLKELIRDRQLNKTANGELVINPKAIREALLCIVTAFALLSGQAGESIGLDLSFFITHLYALLIPLSQSPNLELSSKTLRLDDPLARQSDLESRRIEEKVNLSTEMEMVIKAFDAIFFNKHYKTVSFGTGTNNNLRMVAFAKRLCMTSLHLPDKSCFAALKILENLCVRYSGRAAAHGDGKEASGALAALFSTDDRVMNGVYKADVDEPELSNPAAATIYETFLLERHYSPRVREHAHRLPLRTIGR
ncbi:nucleolar complex-associated protein-domain-containing protein [Dipodascopsis uninucleata]